MKIDALLHAGVLRPASEAAGRARSIVGASTALERWLPGGGWPRGALTEILIPRPGIGEITLLMPALLALDRERRSTAWIDPPHLPHAAALAIGGIDLALHWVARPRGDAEAWWAAEQALASGACAAVMLWQRPTCRADVRMLRRLQFAAAHGRSLAVLFRARRAARDASPAALRVDVEDRETGLIARVLKCRGTPPATPLVLDR